MPAWSAATLRWTPCLILRSLRRAKKRSTWLIQAQLRRARSRHLTRAPHRDRDPVAGAGVEDRERHGSLHLNGRDVSNPSAAVGQMKHLGSERMRWKAGWRVMIGPALWCEGSPSRPPSQVVA